MSVSYKDYYKVLEVGRSATTDEITKSYKKLARKYHPDLNQGDSTAEEKFKDVNEAHDVLKDPQKRRLYDQLGSNWKDGQHFQNAGGFGGFGGNPRDFSGAGDFSDFFEMLFRQQGGGQDFGNPFSSSFGGRQRPRKGQNINVNYRVSLENILQGGPQSITVNAPEGPKNLKVNIPAGCKDGTKLRLSGQGGSGSPNGDLFLTIEYQKHPIFTVDGIDITTEVSIFPWEALFGTKTLVPTLEGNVTLNIPAGSNSGRKLRLKAKGLGTSSQRGDEYVIIMIKTPSLDTMSEKEKSLWQELAEEAQKKTPDMNEDSSSNEEEKNSKKESKKKK